MGKRFSSVFDYLHARTRAVCISVVALLLLSIGGLFFIPLEHSIEVMLPAGSDTQEAIRFLQEIDFSAKVVLSFSEKDDSLDRAEFFAAIDQFAASLDSPLILKSVSTFDDQQMMSDIGFFLQRAPELFGQPELKTLEARLTPEGIGRALRKKYTQLLKPEGSFMGELIRRDPLDIQSAMLEKIRSLSASFGYEIRLEKGHIVSSDGKHVMVILEAAVPFTDSKGSHELIDYIQRQLHLLPPSINAEMVCGHLHTISNEKVVKRDISLTVGIAGTAFVLLFLLFFRDMRANLIFFLPFAALLVAVNLSALLFGTLSMMMLGLGAAIAGIAVDYGIHVYIAVRCSHSPREAVTAVARPVLLGALTTAGVFGAFLFSTIPGYRQLASFALFSVVLSVLGALFVLPLLLIPKGLSRNRKAADGWTRRRSIVAALCFLVLLIGALPLALNVRFDSNIERLDGTEKPIREAEHRFQQIWGKGESGQAIAAVSAPDEETALALNDRMYDQLVACIGESEVASLSRIWKSTERRKENRANWNAFWDAQRIASVKQIFAEKGAPYGFSVDAFAPFFQSLESTELVPGSPAENQIYRQLEQRFVQRNNGEVQMLAYFPDRPEYIEAARKAKVHLPEMVLVSRNAISTTLAQDYTAEFVRISLLAMGFVLFVSFVLLKNWRTTLVVLMPALAGVVSVAVLVSLVGARLNVMNLISGIIVIGLCIDYGIFYVHSYTHSLDTGTGTAISLSAGTTLIGVGALLFANHPALFSVGLTLISGITAGYLTSMLVVPALCHLFLGEKK